MNEIDHYALDGNALRLFLAVLEEGSVTRAARRLDLTQSAVSHGLDRLRRIVDDPLFVKSGRGIVATAHAESLAEPARVLLEKMQAFARGSRFDPATARLSLTIAANDLQRDLLLPTLRARLAKAVQSVSLRILPSGRPTAALLRENRCDLLISPRPPEGSDILQKRLITDRYVCFFDASVRPAPKRRGDYLAAEHITVVYPDNEPLDFDARLDAAGIRRNLAVTVPGFSGIPAFLRGTALIATLPSLLARSTMAGFATVSAPLDTLGAEAFILPLYLCWHRRHHDDPAHGFVRGLIEETASGLGAKARR